MESYDNNIYYINPNSLFISWFAPYNYTYNNE